MEANDYLGSPGLKLDETQIAGILKEDSGGNMPSTYLNLAERIRGATGSPVRPIAMR